MEIQPLTAVRVGSGSKHLSTTSVCVTALVLIYALYFCSQIALLAFCCYSMPAQLRLFPSRALSDPLQTKEMLGKYRSRSISLFSVYAVSVFVEESRFKIFKGWFSFIFNRHSNSMKTTSRWGDRKQNFCPQLVL